MPSATISLRSRGRRSATIKRDPESLQSLQSENEVTSELDQNNSHAPNLSHSLYSEATDTPGTVPSLSYRNGRSDAPTPSEAVDEAPPLLREMRLPPSRMLPPNGNAPEEGSFFQESFRDIAIKLKAYNDALGELQQLGVSHDVQLPELVLVGDQSAGKSSLMSGLAQLDLPRSEGTCTRCPLHIRVSMNPEWSCRVWLRKQYTYSPPPEGPINESDVTDGDPFFPWKKRGTNEVIEFKAMHDNTEIEEVLRWAQVAILNDDQLPAIFVPGSGSVPASTDISEAAEKTAAKFSPNIVALEIKGPDMPNLSFYDMPGIFQNPADARDDYLVSVVTNLSKAYIQHPSAIILCAMPMNSDAENSSTFGLTRKLGASNRTIGVLTKADLLPTEGKHEQWLSIMKGDTHKTGLGYFVTSRPQGRTLEELGKWENLVFVEHGLERWPKDFHEFSKRCGVEKLKIFLSEKLAEAFANSLPNIKKKVLSRREKVGSDLMALPELPANIELEIETCLLHFNENCRKGFDDFVKESSELPSAFRDCLLHCKPKFILRDKSDSPVVEISDDDSEAPQTTPTPTPTQTPSSKRRHNAMNGTPSKRSRLNTSASLPGGHANLVKREEVASPLSTMSATPRPNKSQLGAPFTEFSDKGRGFGTLALVRDHIRRKMKAGVPDVIPADVYEDLALKAISNWERPMNKFLHETKMQLHKKLQEKLDQSFDGLRKRLIYREMCINLDQFLREHMEKTQKDLTAAYKDESVALLTFNQATFNKYKEEETGELRQFRQFMRSLAQGQGERTFQEWKETDKKELEREQARLGLDAFDDEIKVIGYVRGYYRLAALRFADKVAQVTLCRMIPDIRSRLDSQLRSMLNLGAADSAAKAAKYEQLMEEDVTTASLREKLKAEREKFDRALETIEKLERSAGLSGGGGGGGGGGVVSSMSFSQSFLDRGQGLAQGEDEAQSTNELVSGDEA